MQNFSTKIVLFDANMPKIDEIDKKILDILMSNSRTPFTDIALRLNVSEGTVRKRVKRLEDQGVIREYTIDIDPSKLGYRSVTLLGLDTEPEHYLDAINSLDALEQVRWVAKSTGDHMIMAEIWTEDDEELGRLIDENICTINGVKRICPAIILKKMR